MYLSFNSSVSPILIYFFFLLRLFIIVPFRFLISIFPIQNFCYRRGESSTILCFLRFLTRWASISSILTPGGLLTTSQVKDSNHFRSAEHVVQLGCHFVSKALAVLQGYMISMSRCTSPEAECLLNYFFEEFVYEKTFGRIREAARPVVPKPSHCISLLFLLSVTYAFRSDSITVLVASTMNSIPVNMLVDFLTVA